MLLQFSLLLGEYVVCKLEELPIITWDDTFISLTRTSDEISLVCAADKAPASAMAVEAGWRILKTLGQLDFSLVGILAEVASRLADAGISIFAVSTYNTDYILLKQDQLAAAIGELQAAGHQVV